MSLRDRLMRWARPIKRDALAVYLAARDRRVPWYARGLGLCVAAYAFFAHRPDPRFRPVLGYLDDLVVVPLGILATIRLIPREVMAEHRAAATLLLERPVSRAAAAVIALIWVAAILLTAWVGYAYTFSSS
jgi:uncharacterized membrane protein YkvA (DUF1232 family)